MCGSTACCTFNLKWKMGKETGGKKIGGHHFLKSDETAQWEFNDETSLSFGSTL